MNMTDLFADPNKPMTIEELFEARRLPTADDVLRKSAYDVAPSPMYGGEKIPGSYEHFIDKAREPLIGATPCPRRNAADGDPYHDPVVKGTFADHAIVGCGSCDKTWHVPFGMNADNEVEPGEPSERVARYVDPAAETDDADEDEDESDEVDEDDAPAAKGGDEK